MRETAVHFDPGVEMDASVADVRTASVPVNGPLQISGGQAVLFALSIVLGLYADQKIELWGQLATTVVVWAVMLRFLHHARGELRVLMLACLVWSTLGEIFCSLVWGIYTYRLYNVPGFVPPGHVLMLLLALYLAERYRTWLLVIAPAIALAYAAYALSRGIDLLSVCLTPLFIAALIVAARRQLYAATFLAVIPLELYGTWMGNWRWDNVAPGIDLSMANPPICIGAAYCARDILSNLTLYLRGRWQQKSERTTAQRPTLTAPGSAIAPS